MLAAASGSRTRASAWNALSAISISLFILGKGWSTPSRSCASPPVGRRADRVAECTDKAWILLQSAARKPGRLIRAGFFLGAGAVLIGRHSGAVDHRIFVVGVGYEVEHPLPHTALGPMAEPPVQLVARATGHGLLVRTWPAERDGGLPVHFCPQILAERRLGKAVGEADHRATCMGPSRVPTGRSTRRGVRTHDPKIPPESNFAWRYAGKHVSQVVPKKQVGTPLSGKILWTYSP